MEKKRREWVDNGVLHWDPVYSAAEVDAYRAAVKALVEGTITARTFLRQFGQHKLADRIDRQIAAVERLGGSNG